MIEVSKLLIGLTGRASWSGRPCFIQPPRIVLKVDDLGDRHLEVRFTVQLSDAIEQMTLLPEATIQQ